MTSVYYDFGESMVFNHDFTFADKYGNFAAGWQRYRGKKGSKFYWEKNQIIIRNRAEKLASISQQRVYRIPVCSEQVWEVGAIIRCSRNCAISMVVHFIPHNSFHIIRSSLDFDADMKEDYYSQAINIPEGADSAYLEIGIKEPGTIWIQSVMFKQIFPAHRYNTDARGSLNINTIRQITEPVIIKEPLDVRAHILRPINDSVEELSIDSHEKTSAVYDVLYMTTYSFCVINQGSQDVLVTLQISPDSINWVNDDYPKKRVKAGKTKIFVPNYFLRYIRLAVSTETQKATDLLVYFQAQG